MLSGEEPGEAEEIAVADRALFHGGEVGSGTGVEPVIDRLQHFEVPLVARLGVEGFRRPLGRVEGDRVGQRIQIVDIVRTQGEAGPHRRGRAPLTKFEHSKGGRRLAADRPPRHERINLPAFDLAVIDCNPTLRSGHAPRRRKWNVPARPPATARK